MTHDISYEINRANASPELLYANLFKYLPRSVIGSFYLEGSKIVFTLIRPRPVNGSCELIASEIDQGIKDAISSVEESLRKSKQELDFVEVPSA